MFGWEKDDIFTSIFIIILCGVILIMPVGIREIENQRKIQKAKSIAECTTQNTEIYELRYDRYGSTKYKIFDTIVVTDIDKVDNKVIYSVFNDGVIEVNGNSATWTHDDSSVDVLSNVSIEKYSN